jgi:hypothetical protein
MKGVLFLISLLLLFLSCGKKREDKALQNEISLEQRALNYFYDSISFRPLIKEPSKADSGLLVSKASFNWADSLWLHGNLFDNYKVYAEQFAINLSHPPIDTLSFFNSQEYLTDSAKQEYVEYFEFYRVHKSDTSRIKLNSPPKFSIGSLSEFNEKKSNREVIIIVNKNLKSINTQVVEILIIRRILSSEFMKVRFLVFFDSSGNLDYGFFD